MAHRRRPASHGQAHGNAALAFAALADPTRRAIFERIAKKPQAVGKLAEGFRVSRPAVSQHLKALKDAGLVVDRAEGTSRIYHLDPRGLATMRAYLDQLWDRALASFAEEMKRDAAKEDT